MTVEPSRKLGAWSDRVIDRLEKLPLPLWVTLAGAIAIGIVVIHAIEWSFGELPAGQFDAFRMTFPVYPFGILGLIAAQRRVNLNALERFRPVAGFTEGEYERTARAIEYQPFGIVLLFTVLFGALGVIIELSDERAVVRMADFPVAFLADTVLAAIGYSIAGPLVVGVVRLLRRVDRLHREVPNVDLLNPDPVRAFSSATAFAGLSFLIVVTFSSVTDPGTFGTLGGLLLSVLLIALAFASFFFPLWGMHRRLQAERVRMLAEVGSRIETSLARLYRHVDDDTPATKEVGEGLVALVAVRDMIAAQSTWPWRPETLRWLISALVIPLALWGLTRLLEGMF